MSNFIVSDRHIDALVGAAIEMNGGLNLDFKLSIHCEIFHYDNPDEMGRILLEQNYRSVNYRYKENNKLREYKYRSCKLFSPLQILAACDCYDYQSDYCNDYHDTEPARIVNAIRRHFITRLPGYSDMQRHIS